MAASAPTGVITTPFYTTANVLVKWTVNGPYASQKIERQKGDGTGDITTVVDGLGGTVASYTDATVSLDGYYQYRVSGTAGGVTYTSGWVKCHTTPPGPTGLSVVRSSGECDLHWNNNSSSNQIAYQIVRSLPPFTPPLGASTTLGPTAANAEAYSDVSGSLGTGEIKYTLKPYFLAGAAAFASNTGTWITLTVGAVGTAYAPTVTPSAYALNLVTTALVLSIQHNPVDSSAQAAGNVRYRVVGGAVWTTVSIGTASSYTVPAGTLANGSDYEFQAQTAGMNGTLSAWSASVVVSGATNPTITLTAPAAGATVATGTVTVTWTYADGSGRPQAAYRVQLLVAGVVVQSVDGTGAGLSWTSAALTNATNYTINAQVQNSAGLWSTVATRAFSTVFPTPPAPGVVATFDQNTGATTLAITNPAPGGGQVAAVSNNVYRDGVLIASGLAPGATYTDPVPALNTTASYRVEAVSATPSTASTTEAVDTTLGENRWCFLNGGDGYTLLGRMREQLSIAAAPDRDKSLVWFEGRTLPVEYAGQGIARVFRVSGEVRGMLGAPDDPDLIGTWEPFAQLSELPAPLVFRDPLGRRVVCSTSAWSIVHDSQGPEASVGFTVTEVDQT